MKGTVATKEETRKNGAVAERKEQPLFNVLQHEMNRLFEDFKHNLSFTQPAWLEPLAEFHAKMDVKDNEKEIVVTAELPGVEAKDIEVFIRGGGLVIKGEKKQEKEEEEEGFYRSERTYGSFFRRIPLPCDIEGENIKATHKAGVLKIVLPKAKEELKVQKNIEVKAE